MHAAFAQDLRADAVAAQVHAAALGRLRRPRGAVELREQLGAGLAAVEQHRDALASARDVGQAGIQAPGVQRAIEFQRVEHRQRLVHAHVDGVVGGPGAAHQRQMHAVAGLVAKSVRREPAPVRSGARGMPTFSTSDSVRLRCSISAAMVPILRPCSAANSCRSGRRAMVPSSFMTSQITADGEQPAIAARSQPASVWPARISTPPSTACSGKDVAGLHQVGWPRRWAPRRPARCGRGRRPRCRWSRLRPLRSTR